MLRQALFAWAFNPATRDTAPPPQIAAALDWAERASLPVTYLEDTFQFTVADEEMVPENLDSLNAIDAYVGRKAKAA